MSNLDLTVIIPVHSVAGEFESLFKLALDSIEKNDVKPESVLVSRCNCKDVKLLLGKYDFTPYTFKVEVVECKSGSTFQSQVNNAVKKHVKTKYFSVLEFDDQYSNTYFRNILAYSDENPDAGMLLPIVALYSNEGMFNGFVNEAAWARDVSDIYGQVTLDLLLDYMQFNFTGSAVNTEKFLQCGGLKENLKLSFTYELFLRFTNNGNSIMVVPKIGYKHMLFREGSLFWLYKNDPEWLIKSDEETIFWLDAAKKEYFFKNDRAVSYVE